MDYLLISVFFYLAVFYFDMLPLIKSKQKKMLSIYIPIFVLTLAVNVLYGLGIPIPSPLEPVSRAIRFIFQLD